MFNLISGKKGMGIGQVFIFIIAAITFALIMIFGYQAINSFLKSGEEVAFVEFKNDLEIAIKKIHTEYDSLRILDFYPPAKYNQICFVNMDYRPPRPEIAEGNDVEWNEAVILNNIVTNLQKENAPAASVFSDAVDLNLDPDGEITGYDGSSENVFMKPIAPVTIKVHDIRAFNKNGVEEAFLCSNITNGHFKLGLKGGGDHTQIFLPQIGS